jgi:hypothetical protein
LTSARSAQRSTRPIGSEKEGANRIACSHMLNSAHRLQVYLGHSRLDVPAIKHIEKSVTKAAKTSAATSPVRSSNARASPGCIWSRPVSPGWSPPNPSDVTNPGCLTGASCSALGSPGIGSADASTPVSLGSGLITLAAPGFSVGQTRRQKPSANRAHHLSGIANGGEVSGA